MGHYDMRMRMELQEKNGATTCRTLLGVNFPWCVPALRGPYAAERIATCDPHKALE